MLIKETVNDYVALVDSSEPAPGGGSVCGLCGALAIALIRMYGQLSIHKKAFLALEEESQYVFLKRFSMLETKKEELLQIVDADKQAYLGYMEAYRHHKAIQNEESEALLINASVTAIEVPLHAMEISLDAMKLAYELVPYGNKMVLSDLMIGAIYLEATMRSSVYTIAANYPNFTSEKQQFYQNKVSALLEESEAIYKQIKDSVEARLA